MAAPKDLRADLAAQIAVAPDSRDERDLGSAEGVIVGDLFLIAAGHFAALVAKRISGKGDARRVSSSTASAASITQSQLRMPPITRPSSRVRSPMSLGASFVPVTNIGAYL